MYDRSSYHSSQRTRAPQPKRDFLQIFQNWTPKRLLKWLLVLFLALFLGFTLFLGDFAFLLTRAPALTGFPFSERTYLVLFQNNYELRPTGGFISSYGELRFKNGFFKGIEFFDVYGEIDEHKKMEPPAVLGEMLADPNYMGHTFRDANFNPDFPQSKEDILEFYSLTNPDQRIDGVLAVDFTFVENLVGLLGPIELENETLTEENLFEKLSSMVSDIDLHDMEALENRKSLMQPLFQKLMKRAIWPWNFRAILREANSAFYEKHLIFSSNRPRIEKLFASRNWNGALPSESIGDVLVVNEANYGGLKSNRYIQKTMRYELFMTEEEDRLGRPKIKAEITITLNHEGTFNNPMSGPYKAYLRVLFPLGSDVLLGSNLSEKREDFEVLGDMLRLEPGASTTLHYEYMLPEYVWQDGNYLLHLVKQAGTQADLLQVIAHAPTDQIFVGKGWDLRENTAFYESHLLSDEWLALQLLPDQTGPRINANTVLGQDLLRIDFHEKLDEASVMNLDNYALEGLEIASIDLEGNSILIRTAGMNYEAGQAYKMTLNNIYDKYGNSIQPNPRTITFVVPKASPETNE